MRIGDGRASAAAGMGLGTRSAGPVLPPRPATAQTKQFTLSVPAAYPSDGLVTQESYTSSRV